MLFQHDSLCAEKCGFIKPEVKRDVIREVAAAAKGAHAGLLRVRRRGPFQREECGVNKVLAVNQALPASDGARNSSSIEGRPSLPGTQSPQRRSANPPLWCHSFRTTTAG